MVLSDQENNSLVRISEEGTLLNFCKTGRNEAFYYVECQEDQGYAIKNRYQNRQVQQSVVSFSISGTVITPRLLYDLSAYSQIDWRELYPPYLGEEDQLLLAGIDDQKQAWLLRYNLQTGEASTERILSGIRVYQIKYVGPEWYLFIDEEGRLGQFVEGELQTDLLAGQAKTPMHISTCQTRCFVSDSETGSIYELGRDGSAVLYREGSASMGAGYTYESLKLFTTRDRDGEVRIVGLCLGAENAALEEGGEPILYVRVTLKVALLLFGQSLLFWTGGVFLGLCLVFWLFLEILFSRKLLVRIILSTSLAAAGLLAGLALLQRNTYLDTLEQQTLQKFRIISANLIEAIVNREQPGDWPGQSRAYGKKLGLQVKEQYELLTVRGDGEGMGRGTRTINISILYFNQGKPYLYYDKTIPWGYELSDMKKKEYVAALEEALRTGDPVPLVVRSDLLDELLYAESFQDKLTGEKGCVVIEQPRADATAAVEDLDKSLSLWALFSPLLLAVLAVMFWSFLRPLKEIKAAMDEFYEVGSGNQIFLKDGALRDEFYDISRTFNKLSMETRVQMNQLSTINASYARFIPDSVLKILGNDSILEVKPGDCAQIKAGILIAAPGMGTEEGDPALYLQLWSGEIAKQNGVITDYDEVTQAVTAIFWEGADAAFLCAEKCCQNCRERKLSGRLIVHEAELLFGVWGSAEMLHPLAISKDIGRLIAALPELLQLGGTLLVCGPAAQGRQELRPLGTLPGSPPLSFFEAYAFGEPGLALRRRKTLRDFYDGLSLYEAGNFDESKALFARVLREDPWDEAAKWYLFCCEERGRSHR